jgi:ABC-type transport system involved in cytochrome c biogenesis permease subunit
MQSKLILSSILGVTLLCMAAFLYPRRDRGTDFDFVAFGKIPVQHEGRVKPLETLARTSLALLSHRQTWRDEENKKTNPAVVWMLEVMSAELRPVVETRLDDKRRRDGLRTTFDLPLGLIPTEVARAAGLEARPNELYSLNEINKALADLKERMQDKNAHGGAGFNDRDERLAEELSLRANRTKRVLNLDQQVLRIDSPEMASLLRVQDLHRPSFRYSFLEIFGGLGELEDVVNNARPKAKSQRTAREDLAIDLSSTLGRGLNPLLDPRRLAVVPPRTGEEWQIAFDDPKGEFLAIVKAYASKNAERFNDLVAQHLSRLETQLPSGTFAINLESYFQRVEPFWWGMMLYAFLFLVCCVSWIALGVGARDIFAGLNRGAYWSIFAVFVLHTLGILVRMYLQGRPPVTNLYASAVFIGWGCVGLCLLLEAFSFFRYSIALAAGALAGCSTLIIAHLLNRSGDSIDQLEPVLATQFWLATHVVCITIGYTTMFVAGLLGIAYIFTGLFTSAMDRDTLRLFGKIIYGVVCFAMFLSFVGTVLGGIWADQSWGRFWGWDPKENGALLIVIWNAIILHARWGGMIRDRGVAVLAVGGNIITAWSWFGTNLLGVGLHSYGFMAGAFVALIAFVVSQFAIMAIGCIPLHAWRGFQGRV